MTTPKRDDTKIGIYGKFHVIRTDGTSRPGGNHHGCSYFVLDLAHDPSALPALRAYAEACRATHPALAADLDTILSVKPHDANATLRDLIDEAPAATPATPSSVAAMLAAIPDRRDREPVTNAPSFLQALGDVIEDGDWRNVLGIDDMGKEGEAHVVAVLFSDDSPRLKLTVEPWPPPPSSHAGG